MRDPMRLGSHIPSSAAAERSIATHANSDNVTFFIIMVQMFFDSTKIGKK